jgi:hypothetical protein
MYIKSYLLLPHLQYIKHSVTFIKPHSAVVLVRIPEDPESFSEHIIRGEHGLVWKGFYATLTNRVFKD